MLGVDTKTQLSIQKEQEIVYSRGKPENPWPGNTSLGYPKFHAPMRKKIHGQSVIPKLGKTLLWGRF